MHNQPVLKEHLYAMSKSVYIIRSEMKFADDPLGMRRFAKNIICVYCRPIYIGYKAEMTINQGRSRFLPSFPVVSSVVQISVPFWRQEGRIRVQGRPK